MIGQKHNRYNLAAAGMFIANGKNKYYTPLVFENTGALIDADFSKFDNVPVREFRVLIPSRYLPPTGELFFCLKNKDKIYRDVQSWMP